MRMPSRVSLRYTQGHSCINMVLLKAMKMKECTVAAGPKVCVLYNNICRLPYTKSGEIAHMSQAPLGAWKNMISVPQRWLQFVLIVAYIAQCIYSHCLVHVPCPSKGFIKCVGILTHDVWKFSMSNKDVAVNSFLTLMIWSVNRFLIN